MLLLFIFNFSLLLAIFGLLFLIKKTVKNDKTKNRLLLFSSIITIVFHYSSFLYYLIINDDYLLYLKSNPNLILPIYPCNLVMWSCLIIGLAKNKESKFSKILIDYVFWFGILSTLVGMFANVDFIKNPTLSDYEVTKSIVAHATLMFNVLLFAIFGKIEINFKRNFINMVIAVIAMYLVGLYCNLMFEVLVSKEAAYDVNSMFIIHSPFEGVNFLTYPIISVIGLVFYAIIFVTAEFINKKRKVQ